MTSMQSPKCSGVLIRNYLIRYLAHDGTSGFLV